MAFPILAIAGLALSATSEVAGHVAANKAHKANRAASMEAFRLQTRDIAERRQEEAEATALGVSQATTQSFVEQGMAQLAFAENGVAGGSQNIVQKTLARGLSEYRLTAGENQRMTNRSLDREFESGHATMQSRVNSVPKPSLLATGLRLGGSAVNFANQRARQAE